MNATTTVWQHPIIGDVKCIEDDGILQFRGLQYGVLENWLANATLPIYNGNGLDATRFGPNAVQAPGGLEVEQQIIQAALPRPADPGSSGTLCLNLNLSVPKGATANSVLPVLVFIHGGGFFTGANWWPQYDTRRLVRLSVARGQPLIVANINYRLGMAGFMTSQELRDAGYQSNNGHHDQRVALRWIRENISGFGGDPSRVTASGESIGGLSALRLLHPDENLAHRLVVFAGAPPLMNPQPLEVGERGYSCAIKALQSDGLGLSTASDRVAALVSASHDVLMRKMDPTLLFTPLVDGTLISCEPTFDTIAKNPPWKNSSCEAIMVGYAPLDASVFGMMGLLQRKHGIGASFAAHVRRELAGHLEHAESLLQAYNIGQDESQDDTESLIHILTFASDIGYRAPAQALVDSFSRDAFLFEFSEPNPWEGAFKGYTTHVLDVAFLFQNHTELLQERQVETGRQLASAVIDFVHGATPWSTSGASGDSTVAVFRDGAKECKDSKNLTTPGYDVMKRVGQVVGLDFLANVVVRFVFGAPGGGQ